MVIFAKIEVDSVEQNNFLKATITKSISENNASGRVDISYDNPAGLRINDFTVGQQIDIFVDKDVNPATTKIFSGTLVEKTPRKRGTQTGSLDLVARDWTSFLQRNTVEPEVYTNQEVSVIVKDIITKYAPSDFTTTNVNVTGKTIDRIVFKQINIFDALKELADRSGFFFYVDEDKDLHFEEKANASNNLTLNNTNVRQSQFTEDVESVKNKVYVYGAKQFVAVPTEEFSADGGSEFTLQHSPSNTRVEYLGSIQEGAVWNGLQTVASGPDYLVNPVDQQIVWLSGTDLGYNSIPTSGGSAIINYDRGRTIIKVAQDNLSIATYEERTEEITDEAIDDPAIATALAKNTVNLKKNPRTQGSLHVDGIINIVPGKTVIVNLPTEGHSSKTYEVLETTYSLTSDSMQKEKVLRVKVAQHITDLTDVIKNIMLDIKKLKASEIDDKDIITRLLIGAGSYGLKISDWKVKTRTIEHSFILGHPINGKLGSPNLGVNGSQIFLGDQRTALTIQQSGGE